MWRKFERRKSIEVKKEGLHDSFHFKTLPHGSEADGVVVGDLYLSTFCSIKRSMMSFQKIWF